MLENFCANFLKVNPLFHAVMSHDQLCEHRPPKLTFRESEELIIYRQVQKSDRINSDRQSGSDQLGSTRSVSDHEKT